MPWTARDHQPMGDDRNGQKGTRSTTMDRNVEVSRSAQPKQPHLKIPADYSLDSLGTIDAINATAVYPIRQLYGNIPGLSASVRQSHCLPVINEIDFKQYTEALADHGLEFNYIFNAPTVDTAFPLTPLFDFLREC